MRRLAIKRLTASDLTFFEWHFRNKNAGNQKSINLNADVFVQQLYPAVPEVALESGGRLSIDLLLYGPGLAEPENLQRKILKSTETYKNWRLDGEFVHNPADQPERFNALEPGDFAVMGFVGGLAPKAAKVILVAGSVDEDQSLHREIDSAFDGRSMIALTAAELDAVVKKAAPDEAHPIHELTIEEAIEDAARGGSRGVETLLRRPSLRLTQEELAEAKRKAEKIGRLGEEHINHHLHGLKRRGKIDSYDWVSERNAVSPFDFRVQKAGVARVLDVKATAGEFERQIHVSENELREMSLGESEYEIYRLYAVDAESAKLRVASNLREKAVEILRVLSELPDGVRADGVSIRPASLDFAEELEISARPLEVDE